MFYRIVHSVLLIALLISGTAVCFTQEAKPPDNALTAQGLSQHFRSEEGHFTISLPDNPKREFQTLRIGDKPTDAYIFTWSTPFGQYEVKYTDFPISFNEPSLIKYTLDGVRDRLIKGDVSLLSETDISLDGYSGREYRVAAPNGLFIARAYLVGKRLYQLISFMGDDKQLQEATVTLIFDSFKLITPEQEPSPQWREAIEELVEAARAYKVGRFSEAQKHSEKALELNPANKTATFFLARSIHAQYKPGVNTQENIGKARAAIIAYQRILARDPNNEEAYKAIAFLLGDIQEHEEQREWIMRRATNEALPADKRAEAYIVLASQDWNCSYEITGLPENKYAAQRKNQIIIRHRRPKNESDFLRAKQCAANGLENIERAISLEPANDVAWSYKGNLLIEMANLSEMDGRRAQRVEYLKQSAEAMQRNKELQEEKERRAP